MKRKPRIALLVPRYGIVERGVENFTKDLVRDLGGEFEFVIFSRKYSGKGTVKVWAIAEENGLVQYIYNLLPGLKSFLDRYFLNPISIEMLTFSLAAFPQLLLGSYDLIFAQNGVWGAVVCRLVRAIRGTPFIYRSAGGKEPVIIRQKPDVFVATTPEIKEFIEKYEPTVRVELIPNGVNMNSFSDKAVPITLHLQRPVFLCVGELIPSKRIETAIRAVSKLKQGSLLILGSGYLERELRGLGNVRLGKERILLRQVKHEEMAGYYRAADVFTMPAKDEPFGICYLEALASNLPVVAPDDATRRFIVGKAGILYQEEDEESYRQALEKAARRDFGNLPRRQAEKFSWKIIGKKYAKLFKQLV